MRGQLSEPARAVWAPFMASWGATAPASRRPSRCSWEWPSPTSAGSSSWGMSFATLPPAVRGRIAYLAEGHPLYGWMTVAEAVRFARAFHADRWNQRIARPDSRALRDPPAAEAPPVVERPACQRRPGAGDRPRSRPAHPRRSHAGPGHGRPPRFLDVDDPSGRSARGGRSCSARISWPTSSASPIGSASWSTACCASTARPNTSSKA